ncbi:hypothetical protein MtrunA17_Chr6g0458631 [Medicago truncatula]|uniref:Uncharacterized protein n=1 Tax=Medicago truncatula TaxID=3880 RepID=A0A396HI16_MEDTR|nr:hypothetical protein MtrunA17_Chr6g0458631 [Medicago truncatula]
MHLYNVLKKLSISKAVTPRQPKKKVKGTHQTYYHLKDVSFLYREPLLEEHRTIRVHDRKIKKAETKKNYERTDSTPPPYLSPFVNYDEEGYIPENAKTINHLQAAARKEFLPLPSVGKEDSLHGALAYTSADFNVDTDISLLVMFRKLFQSPYACLSCLLLYPLPK